MPITTEILQKLSTTSGSAGNSQAGTPAGSLGKYISTTALSGTALGALFDDVTGDEAAAGDVEYRCLFLHNSHATLTWIGPVIWLTEQAAETVAISVDTTAASAVGSTTAQAKTIADEQDSGNALSGQTFSSPTSKAAGLAIGDLAPGQCRAVWFRRTVGAGASAVNNDTVQWRAEGDTNA